MEKTRKTLKEMSIVMLILAGLSFIKSVIMVVDAGLTLKGSPDYSDGALIAGIVVLCIFGLVLSIPQIYIGVRGIKVANNPVATKGHIVWAIVLSVIAILGTISAIVTLIQNGANTTNILDLSNMVLDVCVLTLYIRSAKAVQREA